LNNRDRVSRNTRRVEEDPDKLLVAHSRDKPITRRKGRLVEERLTGRYLGML